MKATIDCTGLLIIKPENELEDFALKTWVKGQENLTEKIMVKAFEKKEKKNKAKEAKK